MLVKKQYKYTELGLNEGNDLVEKLGFNPMTVIDLDVSEKELDRIAVSLVKNNLYVATEDGRSIKKYFPPDAEIRSELVKISMQKEKPYPLDLNVPFFLLMYSNLPNEIRDFGEKYEPLKSCIVELKQEKY